MSGTTDFISRDPWEIPDRTLLTSSELDGTIPLPSRTLAVILNSPWAAFSEFLSRTAGAVNRSLVNSSLSYKVNPYQDSLPRAEEYSVPFFLRNARKVRSSGDTIDELDKLVLDNPVNPEMFPQNYISVRLFAGEDIQGFEEGGVSFPINDKKQRFIRRTAAIRSKYDIDFGVGFDSKDRWFYQIDLANGEHEQIYSDLCKNIERLEPVPMMLRKERCDEQRGFRLVTYE